MINNSEIYNKVCDIFLNKVTGNVNLNVEDSKYSGVRVDIKYIAAEMEEQTIGRKYYGGYVRCFIYDKNPLMNYKKSDELVLLLDDQTIDNLNFKVLSYISSPTAEENGDLFVSAIDFEVKTCLS